MSKSTYINAECVDGTVTIHSGGKGIDVLMLSAMVFCNTLESHLKKGCPEGDPGTNTKKRRNQDER